MPGEQDMWEYKQHQSAFQKMIFDEEDTFTWAPRQPVLSEFELEQLAYEGRVKAYLADYSGPPMSTLQHCALRTILYVSGLQELEIGPPQIAELLHCLGVLRAHVDGAYTCGQMLQWERCYGPPADVCYLVKETLKMAASYLHTAKHSPLCQDGRQAMADCVGRLQRGQQFTDRAILSSSKQSTASCGEVQASVATKLCKCVYASARVALELFILWHQGPREEGLCLRAWQIAWHDSPLAA